VSKPLGFPSWRELVTRLAEHDQVQGNHILTSSAGKLPDTSNAQMLFQHYRTKSLETSSEPTSSTLERRIQGQWRRIIHECLYRDVPAEAEDLKKKHPYLKHFLKVISDSTMTVNYNFDDTIQQLLLLEKTRHDPDFGRNFETVWNAYLPFRPRLPILYHPNGFLPRNLLEFPSETLVLSEDSFADQLIESMAGHHASLLHHLSKTTCVLIGLSLQDATLRHLLRQNAVINPGHYHYYIHFTSDDAELDPATKSAIRDANFEVYNLVTLFMDNDDIAALGRLLTMPERQFRRGAEENGSDIKYFYYLTGAVGAGKTTCLSYFGSFKTYEEWTESRPPELGKSWKDLFREEQSQLDRWIVRQFDLKNCELLDRQIGIHVIDRAPLDPIAFTEESEIPAKAHLIAEGLRPGAAAREIQPGQVVLLTGKPEDMEARVVGRHKESKADVIEEMQGKMRRIFAGPGAPSEVNTWGLSIHQVVKRVARIIHLEEYKPTNLTKLLHRIESDGLPSAAEI
jgi:hypothetical protein